MLISKKWFFLALVVGKVEHFFFRATLPAASPCFPFVLFLLFKFSANVLANLPF